MEGAPCAVSRPITTRAGLPRFAHHLLITLTLQNRSIPLFLLPAYVFLDGYGHVTERANAVIGDSIAGLVTARLGRRGD